MAKYVDRNGERTRKYPMPPEKPKHEKANSLAAWKGYEKRKIKWRQKIAHIKSQENQLKAIKRRNSGSVKSSHNLRRVA